MPRAFLIHGWMGGPKRDWFPWAKTELEKRGYEVFVPAMPGTAFPKIVPWVAKINEIVGTPMPEDIFIGHSMGCQGILRYIETLPEGTKVGQIILTAGFEKLKSPALETLEDWVTFKPWAKTPIDYGKIKKIAGSVTAIFSDNDPLVSYEDNSKIFEEKLGATIVVEHGMGHLSQEDNIYSLPILLELLK